MKFIAVASLPVAALAAINPRAGAPARPDIVGLNKSIIEANTVLGACSKAVGAFNTQGVTDSTSLETSCVPMDDKFAMIGTILDASASLERPDDLKDLKGIETTFSAMLKALDVIEAQTTGTGAVALGKATCGLFAKNANLGAPTVKTLQKLALLTGGVLPGNAVAADNFAKKIIESTKTAKSSCGSGASTSSTSTSTSTSTGVVLPPAVSRTQDGPSPTPTAGSGSGAAEGTGSGASTGARPSGLVTAGAAESAPKIIGAVVAAAGAVFML